MKKETPDREYFCFVKENKLSVNFDINYKGIEKQIQNFKEYWINSFELLKVYLKILDTEDQITWAKANLFLYKLMLKIEKRYGK